MTRLSHIASALLLAFGSVSTAEAATLIYNAQLSGLNESPSNASPGTGSALVTIDDVLHTMRVQTTFSGLLTNTTAAHIHIRPANVPNGGVVTQLPSFEGFPLGVTSGTYDLTFNLMAASTYNPAFLNNATNQGSTANAEASLLLGLNSGLAYLNIHTVGLPSGEIRANFLPEPGTWAMMIVGFGFVGAALRRRMRSGRPGAPVPAA